MPCKIKYDEHVYSHSKNGCSNYQFFHYFFLLLTTKATFSVSIPGALALNFGFTGALLFFTTFTPVFTRIAFFAIFFFN